MDSVAIPSLRYLKIFETVARLENLSRASSEIHLSQPAVTQAIAKLETEVGAVLFERRHTGTYLTRFGEILLKRTRRLFQQMEAAIEHFTSQHGQPRATIAAIASRITRTQIICLKTLATRGPMLEAAQAQGLSSLSLHRSIRTMEAMLGQPLCQHTAQGTAATRKGLEFARHVSLATHEIESALEELDLAKGLIGGRIAVGTQLLGCSFLLGSVVNRIVQLYPDARVQIFNDGYNTLLHALRSGLIDAIVGLRRNPSATDVVEELLFLDPYVAVARRGHPLANKKAVTRSDLGAYDWVVPARGAIRRAAFEALFAKLKRQPRVIIETYSLTTIRAILAESDHITLLTKYEMLFEEQMGKLTSLNIGPFEPPAAIGVTTRTHWVPTKVQLEFLELLRDAAKCLVSTPSQD